MADGVPTQMIQLESVLSITRGCIIFLFLPLKPLKARDTPTVFGSEYLRKEPKTIEVLVTCILGFKSPGVSADDGGF